MENKEKSKLFILSQLDGNLNKLKHILQSLHLIDNKNNKWIDNNSYFVLLGDFLTPITLIYERNIEEEKALIRFLIELEKSQRFICIMGRNEVNQFVFLNKNNTYQRYLQFCLKQFIKNHMLTVFRWFHTVLSYSLISYDWIKENKLNSISKINEFMKERKQIDLFKDTKSDIINMSPIYNDNDLFNTSLYIENDKEYILETIQVSSKIIGNGCFIIGSRSGISIPNTKPIIGKNKNKNNKKKSMYYIQSKLSDTEEIIFTNTCPLPEINKSFEETRKINMCDNYVLEINISCDISCNISNVPLYIEKKIHIF